MRRFNPEKELYKIQHGSRNKIILGIITLLIILGISSSYALYQVRYSKRIIYTKVAPFNNRDIILTVLVDGKSQNDFPNSEEGYYFNGLDCDTKNVTTATWDYNLWAINLVSTKPNKCDVIFGKDPAFLNDRIKYNATTESNIVDDETKDHNLRYIGANPNNYIWFNCDSYSDITKDNAVSKGCEKWRIIGLFNSINKVNGNQENLIKIIKADNIGTIPWNSGGKHDWESASLQESLNNTYYNGGTLGNAKGITNATRNMIEKTKWTLGGWTTESGILASQYYTYERGTTTWDGYIGLMYLSDYGYATNGTGCLGIALNKWSSGSNKTNCADNSWLLDSTNNQLTLTLGTYDSNRVFIVQNSGGVTDNFNANLSRGTAVTSPSLYLKSSIKVVSGNGSSNFPYILTQ